MVRKRQRGHVGFDKREWSYVLFEGLDEPPSAHWFGEFILPKHWIPPNLELSTHTKKKKIYYCNVVGLFAILGWAASCGI